MINYVSIMESVNDMRDEGLKVTAIKMGRIQWNSFVGNEGIKMREYTLGEVFRNARINGIDIFVDDDFYGIKYETSTIYGAEWYIGKTLEALSVCVGDKYRQKKLLEILWNKAQEKKESK